MPSINYREFASRIKAQYPQLQDVDDLTIAKRIVGQKPELQGKVFFGEEDPAVLQAKHDANVAAGANQPRTLTERIAQAIPQKAYDIAVPTTSAALRIVPSVVGGMATPLLGPLAPVVGGMAGEMAGQAFEKELGERKDLNFGVGAAEGGLNALAGGVSKVITPASKLGRIMVQGLEGGLFGQTSTDLRSLIEKGQLADFSETVPSTLLGAGLGAGAHALAEVAQARKVKLDKIRQENAALEAEAVALDAQRVGGQDQTGIPDNPERGSFSTRPVDAGRIEKPYEATPGIPEGTQPLPPSRQLPERVPTAQPVEKAIELSPSSKVKPAQPRDVLTDIEEQPIEKWIENHMGVDKKTADFINNVHRTSTARKAAEAAVAVEDAPVEGWAKKLFSGAMPKNERGSITLAPRTTERLEGHGGVGGKGASVEELNRPGNFYKVGRSGLTFLGKQVDASLKPGEAIMQAMPDGSVKTYATEGLNFKQAEAMFSPQVKKAHGQRGSINMDLLVGGSGKHGEIFRGKDTEAPPAKFGKHSFPSKLKSEEGYLYHATNEENAQSIAAEGKIRLHRPNEGTPDQDFWPDGDKGKRAYFSTNAANTASFAPENGSPVLLRVKRGAHSFRKESGTGDYFTNKEVNAGNVEYLGDDKQWHPLSRVADPDGVKAEAQGLIDDLAKDYAGGIPTKDKEIIYDEYDRNGMGVGSGFRTHSGMNVNDIPVLQDLAHTPEAIANALKTRKGPIYNNLVKAAEHRVREWRKEANLQERLPEKGDAFEAEGGDTSFDFKDESTALVKDNSITGKIEDIGEPKLTDYIKHKGENFVDDYWAKLDRDKAGSKLAQDFPLAESLKVQDLPDYAQRTISQAKLPSSEWQRETVPVESLRKRNGMLWGEGEHRPSQTKGPIVLNKAGDVIDGNNRTIEAIKRGDETIEVFKPKTLREQRPGEAGFLRLGRRPQVQLSPEEAKVRAGYTEPAQPVTNAKKAIKKGWDATINALTDRTIYTKRAQDIVEKEHGGPLPQIARAREEALRWPGRMARVEENLREKISPHLKNLDSDQFDTLKDLIAAEDAITKANATGNQNRVYSGGYDWQEAQQAIINMEARLGTARFQQVQDAANAVYKYNHELLKKDLDSGNISQALYNDLTTKFDKYNRVRIAEYIKQSPDTHVGGAAEFFRNSDTGLRKLSEAGTSKRMLDPLESMIMSAFETENRVVKNDIANAIASWKQLSPTMDGLIQKVPADHKFTNAEAKMQARFNGKLETYSIPKAMEGIFHYADSSDAKALSAVGKWLGKGLLEAGAVRRNPLFLTTNALVDATQSMIRGLNPKDLVRGYMSAFKNDKWAKQARLSGATMGTGFYSTTPKDILSEISSKGHFEIRDARDLKRFADLAAFGWVSKIGEKIENAPRIAAFRKEFEKSGDELKAGIAGRDITVDFAKGGWLAKNLNMLTPFFNVGVQGALVIPRTLANPEQRNRLIAGMGVLTVVGASMEAYNRTFESYKDIPQYVKDQGLIFMLKEKQEEDGKTTPYYLNLNLREFAPVVTAVREGFNKAYGDEGKSFADFAAGVAASGLPVKGEGVSGKVAAFVPPLPKAAMQVGTNKDFYRGRDINPPNEMRINTPEDRFGPYQTGMSKWLSKHGLGKHAGLGPRDIESIAGTMGGGGAMQSMREVDNVGKVMKGEVKDARDVPGLSSFISQVYKSQGGEQQSKKYKDFTKDSVKLTRDTFKEVENLAEFKALTTAQKQTLQRQISSRADKMVKFKLGLLDKDKAEDYDGPTSNEELLDLAKDLLAEIE